MDAGLVRTRHDAGAADDMDLAVDDGCARGAALRRHRRERLPRIGCGIVLPSLADRHPGRGAGFRQPEAAECVDLVVVAGERDVVRRDRHRLLLRPPVGRRIVFEHQPDRFPAGREPGKDVEPATRDRAQNLLGRLRKRRELDPGSAGAGRWRRRMQRVRAGRRLRRRLGEGDGRGEEGGNPGEGRPRHGADVHGSSLARAGVRRCRNHRRSAARSSRGARQAQCTSTPPARSPEQPSCSNLRVGSVWLRGASRAARNATSRGRRRSGRSPSPAPARSPL